MQVGSTLRHRHWYDVDPGPLWHSTSEEIVDVTEDLRGAHNTTIGTRRGLSFLALLERLSRYRKNQNIGRMFFKKEKQP